MKSPPTNFQDAVNTQLILASRRSYIMEQARKVQHLLPETQSNTIIAVKARFQIFLMCCSYYVVAKKELYFSREGRALP